MKRYFVFVYDWYYPAGGMGDCFSAHDTLEEARGVAKNLTGDSVEIWDMETIEMVDSKEPQ